MKKIITVILSIVLLASIMFVEYRYIMANIKPYKGKDNIIYVEIFGQVDTYYDNLVPIKEV